MAALLDMLAYSEGTSTVPGDDGYNVNVGGQIFRGYVTHPRIPVLTRWGWSDARRGLKSLPNVKRPAWPLMRPGRKVPPFTLRQPRPQQEP